MLKQVIIPGSIDHLKDLFTKEEIAKICGLCDHIDNDSCGHFGGKLVYKAGTRLNGVLLRVPACILEEEREKKANLHEIDSTYLAWRQAHVDACSASEPEQSEAWTKENRLHGELSLLLSSME